MIISFIGLGEVGSTYSCGLAQAGAKVKGYDTKFAGPAGKAAFKKCQEQGVELVDSPAALIEGADIVLAITSCHQALETAETYKPFLSGRQSYVEMNSATPKVKENVQNFLGESCRFVDGTTLNSPVQYGIKTPIAMSGVYGKEVAGILNGFGMDIRYLGEKVGQASAFKVLRSIFTKGMISTLYESLTAARSWGIRDELFQRIIDFYTKDTKESLTALAGAATGEKEEAEMREIFALFRNAGLSTLMLEGAMKG